MPPVTAISAISAYDASTARPAMASTKGPARTLLRPCRTVCGLAQQGKKQEHALLPSPMEQGCSTSLSISPL
jgi:hypothetical protein